MDKSQNTPKNNQTPRTTAANIPAVISIGVPVCAGLLLALLVIVIKPDWVLPPTHPLLNTQPAHTGFADAVAKAAPAVVSVFSRRHVRTQPHPLLNDPLFRQFFNEPPINDTDESLGSGVIMTASGYVMTNHHVIANADQIVVALADGREANARVVGSDADSDIAVLHIKLDNLPVITPVVGEHVHVGDAVLAIGNPFGVGQTVTQGIISATERNKLGLNTYENYLQTDAAINPGNSGGALVNVRGELIGINTAIYSRSGGSQGIGFAIPADIVLQALSDIAKYGEIIRGWIGINARKATPSLLAKLSLPKALTGFVVTGLYPNGPAEKAGIKMGDIITSIDQQDTQNTQQSLLQVASVRPGQAIQLELIRNGQSMVITAIAGKRPK